MNAMQKKSTSKKERIIFTLALLALHCNVEQHRWQKNKPTHSSKYMMPHSCLEESRIVRLNHIARDKICLTTTQTHTRGRREREREREREEREREREREERERGGENQPTCIQRGQRTSV